MSCLNEADPEPASSWPLWLDFWAQAARNAEVASVRQKSDERWRDVISTLVQQGQEAGEFRQIDAGDFAIYLSTLLDGLTIQIALNDPVVDSVRAFELSMHFVADQLGFDWTPDRSRERLDGLDGLDSREIAASHDGPASPDSAGQSDIDEG
jgi:hypothetical protein